MVFLNTPTRGQIVYFISILHDCTRYGYSSRIQVGRSLFYYMYISYWSGNQFIKEIKGLRTDWWGKHTSGILIGTYMKSMELFNITLGCLLYQLEKELHTGICSKFITYFTTTIIYILWFGRESSICILTICRWYYYKAHLFYIGQSSGSNLVWKREPGGR